MQSTLNEPDSVAWNEIAPLLDEAMGKLGKTDRNAILLRFFGNKTVAEVGSWSKKQNKFFVRFRHRRTYIIYNW
jgi:hypothetical protein